MLTGFGLIPHILPDSINFGIILLLILIALITRRDNSIRFMIPSFMPVAMALFVYISSTIINNSSYIITIIFIRTVYEPYIFLLALVNLNLNDRMFKKINKTIFFFAVIQIPAAIVKLIIFGAERDVIFFGGSRLLGAEIASGTFGRAAGTMGTLFPLIVIGFLIPFYIQKHKVKYIYLILGFVLFSFLTGKRAFLLILPIFLYFQYRLMKPKMIKTISYKKITFKMLAIGVVIFILGVKLTPMLNPSNAIWGKFDINYLFTSVKEYIEGENISGQTIGRLSTMKNIMEVRKDYTILEKLFGKGPGLFIKSGLTRSTYKEGLKEIGIAYGVTGFGWLILQVGILGVICYLLLIWMLFRFVKNIYKQIKDPYWKAITVGSFGVFIVIMFDFFAYSVTSLTGKIIPTFFFFVLAQIFYLKNIYLNRLPYNSYVVK